MKLKILMILDNGFKPDLRVQKEINTLIKLGYSVDLYCWDQEGNLPVIENNDELVVRRVNLVVEKQQGLKKVIDLLKFYYYAYKEINPYRNQYHYIYVHDFLDLPFGVLLKLRFRLPLIYDAHEIYHLMEWEKYNALIRKLIFISEKFLLKFVDSFIVVNKKRKEFYSNYVNNDINIIGNWYDPYEGEYIELRKVYLIPNDDIIVSYFGVINFNERPINLFIEELMKYPQFHFFIAGAGKDEDKVVEFENKYQKVHYLGWQSNIRKYLKDVDYIIYFLNDQRKYFEFTAPNTLYMAISHCKPIITNVPGESEDLIKHFNIGYFIDNPSNLQKKIDFSVSSNEYKQKISSIEMIKDKFRWSECETVYKKIFTELDKKA